MSLLPEKKFVIIALKKFPHYVHLNNWHW
jgi:hypothetical protein